MSVTHQIATILKIRHFLPAKCFDANGELLRGVHPSADELMDRLGQLKKAIDLGHVYSVTMGIMKRNEMKEVYTFYLHTKNERNYMDVLGQLRPLDGAGSIVLHVQYTTQCPSGFDIGRPYDTCDPMEEYQEQEMGGFDGGMVKYWQCDEQDDDIRTEFSCATTSVGDETDMMEQDGFMGTDPNQGVFKCICNQDEEPSSTLLVFYTDVD